MADNYVVDPEDIVTLQDENGENVEYEFLDLVEYQEKEYVATMIAIYAQQCENVLKRID